MIAKYSAVREKHGYYLDYKMLTIMGGSTRL